MRVFNDDAQMKLYFTHRELSPNNVRFTDTTRILPEVGDRFSGEFGYMGEEVVAYVVEVRWIGGSTNPGGAYDVFLTSKVP